MNYEDYHSTYNANFFRRADGYDHWQRGQMRCGDALAAVGYALGWPSWTVIRAEFGGLTEHGKEPRDLRAPQQLDVLHHKFKRWPKRVLDVGGGRGEVTMAFRYFGIPVTAIEPHKDAAEWFEWTWGKLFDGRCRDGVEDGKYELLNCQIEDVEIRLESDADTVLLVETLEHLEAPVFDKFWKDILVPLLERNKGRFIVTNWLDYHPLKATGSEHCRQTDDNLYDRLAEGHRVVYRRGSHMVLDFE